MSYRSINPFNGECRKIYNEIKDDELNDRIELSGKAYQKWRNLTIEQRLQYFPTLSNLLQKELELHARLISLEMGKPIKQSKAEIEKCVLAINYYFNNAEELLNTEKYSSYADESYVVFQPMGIIYGIMPWNFPYWQVLRFVIPNLILGNTVFLKHASNVPQCAEAIETLLITAGFPEGVFQNLFINYEQSDRVIAHPFVRGITFTGSEAAGSKVAGMSGKCIKKTVLELGGSDPFIVLNDADLDKVIDQAVFARMQNAGQSCISAKRFFIHTEVYSEFLEGFARKIQSLKSGDPLDLETDIGPMAAEYLLVELDGQVQKSLSAGAKLITGGKRKAEGSLFYEPTLIEAENMNIPVCAEETFGPVAVVKKFSDEEEMIGMVNNSCFGLGASVWSRDLKKATEVANRIESGMVTINGIVKSDPALPFGGTKSSGYGRELAGIGLKEFSNAKTIVIHY